MLSYKCLRCGAPIQYKPGTDTAGCDYCNAVFTLKELDDFAKAEAAKEAAKQAAAGGNNPSGGPGAGSTQAPTGIGAAVPGAVSMGGPGVSTTQGAPGAQAGAAGGEAPQTVTVSAADYLAGPKESAEPVDNGNLAVYHCNSCGADIVADPATAASICYYCHSPVIMQDRLSGTFAPARIIPFKIDQEAIKTMFKEKIAKNYFVPKSFTADSQFDKIKGVYLPFWNVDVQVDVQISGEGRNISTRRSGNTEYTTTSVYQFNRRGMLDLKNICAYASQKIEAQAITSISPFDEEEAKEYSPGYITGFFAENYDMDTQAVKPMLDKIIAEQVDKKIAEYTREYDRVELQSKNAQTYYQTPYLILKPVYIMTYRYLGKTFIYTVNGQNMNYYGEIPMDTKKLGITAALVALGLGIIVFLICWFFAV